MVQELMKPVFSEEGSNAKKYEGEVYGAFIKYAREAASKLNVISTIHYKHY